MLRGGEPVTISSMLTEITGLVLRIDKPKHRNDENVEHFIWHSSRAYKACHNAKNERKTYAAVDIY